MSDFGQNWEWWQKLLATLVVDIIIVWNMARVLWPDKFRKKAGKEDVR